MKKLIALLLILCMLVCFCACSAPSDKSDGDIITGGDAAENDQPTVTKPAIVVPEYKDYGRGSKDFGDLVYSRPNMQSIIDDFNEVTESVSANTTSVSEQIDKIRSLEAGLNTVKTMYSLAEIYRSKNTSNNFWQVEYSYISASYPRLSQSVEKLTVACARSENKAVFEQDYFKYSLDAYVDGGTYTDEVVSLMEEEAVKEAEYSSLSTATVRIVYDSAVSDVRWEGTVDEVIAMAREHYANDEQSYKKALISIDILYNNALKKLQVPIYVELVKIRRLLADELGLESYVELAYDNMKYDYAPENMISLINSVGKYVSPVANELERTVFQSYFQKNVQPALNTATMMNTLYEVYTKLGGNYSDAYSYMLQHALYDVGGGDDRYDGAFTSYLPNNSSPYLFATSSGFLRDYLTVSHEFGHFLDMFVNGGESDSLAMAEIYSQALELLTTLKLKDSLYSPEYEYLDYYTVFTFLNKVLLMQSFYSAFEHIAYELEYDEISAERLNEAVNEAFDTIYGAEITLNADLSLVTTPHTVLYPFYVESYVSAGIVSLDIFFMESHRTGSAGSGFAVYSSLLNHSGSSLSFSERLESVGLDSPFKDGKVKQIGNNLYFHVMGKNYYKECDDEIGAA